MLTIVSLISFLFRPAQNCLYISGNRTARSAGFRSASNSHDFESATRFMNLNPGLKSHGRLNIEPSITDLTKAGVDSRWKVSFAGVGTALLDFADISILEDTHLRCSSLVPRYSLLVKHEIRAVRLKGNIVSVNISKGHRTLECIERILRRALHVVTFTSG